MKSSKHRTPVGGEREPIGIGALAERFGLATHVLRQKRADPDAVEDDEGND